MFEEKLFNCFQVIKTQRITNFQHSMNRKMKKKSVFVIRQKERSTVLDIKGNLKNF